MVAVGLRLIWLGNHLPNFILFGFCKHYSYYRFIMMRYGAKFHIAPQLVILLGPPARTRLDPCTSHTYEIQKDAVSRQCWRDIRSPPIVIRTRSEPTFYRYCIWYLGDLEICRGQQYRKGRKYELYLFVQDSSTERTGEVVCSPGTIGSCRKQELLMSPKDFKKFQVELPPRGNVT